MFVVAQLTPLAVSGVDDAWRMAAKDELGRRGEAIAAEVVRLAGMRILARNWRCPPHGELDLVALDGGVLVAIEVKTRSGLAHGHPLEAVTPAKYARLRRLIALWRDAHPELAAECRGTRIDVVAIVAPSSGDPVVEHLRGVFL